MDVKEDCLELISDDAQQCVGPLDELHHEDVTKHEDIRYLCDNTIDGIAIGH